VSLLYAWYPNGPMEMHATSHARAYEVALTLSPGAWLNFCMHNQGTRVVVSSRVQFFQ
jgi:hypothetical protein